MQHTQEILPEVPGPGKQETLHYRALQDVFIIRPLLPRARDTADFLNTEIQGYTK